MSGSYWAEHGLPSPVGEPSREEARVLRGLAANGATDGRARWRTVRDALRLDGLAGVILHSQRNGEGMDKGMERPRTVDEPHQTLGGKGNAIMSFTGTTSGALRVIGAGANPHGKHGGGAGNAGPWIETGHRTTAPGGDRTPHQVSIDRPSPTVRSSEGTGMLLVDPGEVVYPPGHGRAATEPDRLDQPAPTVTTQEAKGTRASRSSGYDFHGGPDRASDAAFLATGRRRLTVAECAVLQDFRPDYPFKGTKEAKYRQVGNAVPPGLARALGEAIALGLDESVHTD